MAFWGEQDTRIGGGWRAKSRSSPGDSEKRTFQDTLYHGSMVHALAFGIHHHAPDPCAQELGLLPVGGLTLVDELDHRLAQCFADAKVALRVAEPVVSVPRVG